jgi:hypothetical protein
MESDAYDISSLIRALRQSGEYDRVPSYNDVWRAVAEGRIPATREKRGWKIRREDRERAAEALGLSRRPVAA